MDYKKLVKALLCDGFGVGEDANGCANKKCKYRDADGACDLTRMCGDAAIAINELLVENQALRNAANGFKKQLEAAEARVEKTDRERNAAVKTIFKWTGCPECKHWDSKDEWCKKYDRYANSFGRCSTPECWGLKEE